MKSQAVQNIFLGGRGGLGLTCMSVALGILAVQSLLLAPEMMKPHVLLQIVSMKKLLQALFLIGMTNAPIIYTLALFFGYSGVLLVLTKIIGQYSARKHN